MTVRSRATVSVKAHYHRPEHKLSIEQITSRTPCEIHLRFEAWSNVARKSVPVPQGIPVDLVDHRPDGTVHTLLKGATDAGGHVAFVFDLEALGRPKLDVAFVVRAAGRSSADVVLPETWSSKERKTVNGRPGFYPAYEGEPIARDVAPLTFTMPVSAKFYLQFEVWDLIGKKFVPLPQDIPVDLFDDYPLLPDKVATANTDAAGRVHFEIPDLSLRPDPRPDIYFVVRSGGIAHANHEKLPKEWSTKGWLASDGKQPGFLPDYQGGTIGSPNAPVVFRIGLDIHLVIEYSWYKRVDWYDWYAQTRDKWRSYLDKPKNVLAPPGVVVNIRRNYLRGKGPLLATLKTDLKGQVHGVIFDARSEDDIAVEVVFETSDPAIGLPKSQIAVSPWTAKPFENVRKGYTSLPWPPFSAFSLLAETDNRNVALYFLKVLREVHGFLWHITNGAWKGIEDLKIRTDTPASFINSFSWPMGSVWIKKSAHWNRGTIAHELAHQVVWKEAGFSNEGIAFEGLFRQLKLIHYSERPENSEHAFIEGWPELIEAIFAGPARIFPSRPPSSPDPADPFHSDDMVYFEEDLKKKKEKVEKMSPPPLSKGESLEGAFAIGLYRIFREHVLAGKYPASGQGKNVPLVPETFSDGDITAAGIAPWVKDLKVQERFLGLIWEPLNALHGKSNPTTTLYLQQMRDKLSGIEEENRPHWHELRADLYRLYMAMAHLTVERIEPAEGLSTSHNKIKVIGSNFIKGMNVRFESLSGFGSLSAFRIDVTSDSEVEVETPLLKKGSYEVTVEIRVNGYVDTKQWGGVYKSK